MQDSQRETGISATKIWVSEPTKIPTGFSTGGRTPAAKISAAVLAKFPLGFLARSEIPAAKISAGSRWQSRQDPAGIHVGERKLGGQNLGGRSRQRSRREAKSRRPKSRRDPGGNPAKIPPGFTAGNENSAAKILAGDPASALGAKRNPGGQNLGGIPVVIPPRSRRDSRRGTEIPAAKISAGPGGNPGGIPPRSRQDPGGFFTRASLTKCLI